MATIVVLGASFAGLLAGAAASRAGHDVIVIERDLPPAEPVARDGVPQGRQPHVLLHRGLMAIEELLPGIEQELLALGGVRFNTGMMPWLGEYGWMPQRDWAYEIISLSRPLLEQAVRERVGALPRVELRFGVTAAGLRRDDAGWEVLVRDGSAVAADLVVDASGRSSRLPHWLAELGVRVPEPEVVEAQVGYASRTYRGRGPLRTGIVVASTPATRAGALALAIEDDRWLVSAVGFGDRRPGRTPAEFEAFLAGLRDPAMVELTSLLEPEGDVAVHRQTGNRRYAYGRAGGWRPGLLVVGDAMCAFNPVYGQGITVAACQAALLAAALREPPTTLTATRRLQRRLGAVAGLPWSVATSEDCGCRAARGTRTGASGWPRCGPGGWRSWQQAATRPAPAPSPRSTTSWARRCCSSARASCGRPRGRSSTGCLGRDRVRRSSTPYGPDPPTRPRESRERPAGPHLPVRRLSARRPHYPCRNVAPCDAGCPPGVPTPCRHRYRVRVWTPDTRRRNNSGHARSRPHGTHSRPA